MNVTRIVEWAEFAALPPGTLFSYYVPAVADGLYVKGDTIEHNDGTAIDFFECDLIACQYNGEDELCVADSEGRWGMFNYKQQFVVYGDEDRARMARLVATGRE